MATRNLVDVAAGQRANATRRLMINDYPVISASCESGGDFPTFFLDPITACIGAEPHVELLGRVTC